MKKSSIKRSTNVNLEELASSAKLDLKQVDLSELISGEVQQFCHRLGLLMVEQFMLAELDQLLGAKYSRENETNFYRWGSQLGSVVLGAQKTPVTKPRVRQKHEDGSTSEVSLESYAAFNKPDAMSKAVLNRLLSGVSSRDFSRTVEQVSDATGLSKSTFSRKAIKATADMAKKFEETDLSKLDTQVILIDGTLEGEQLNLVAVSISADGTKHLLGIEQGSTENATVCAHLLQDLIDRGLDPAGEYLFLLDGSKALKKAVKQVFGQNALIQRCLEHKIRNILDYLPEQHKSRIRKKLRAAWSMNSYKDAKEALLKIVDILKDINETAAESLLEALEDTLTLHKLETPKQLRRTLQTTNVIESWNSVAKNFTKQVKKWKTADHVKRWLIAGMLEAQRRSHKVEGFSHLKQLKINMHNLITNQKKLPNTNTKNNKVNQQKSNKTKQAA
jgi:transposase-like protein